MNTNQRGAVAYHGEIGREATASRIAAMAARAAYHGEIGREATALNVVIATLDGAYHGEIGREATASMFRSARNDRAYHGEIGREATANPGPDSGPRPRSNPGRAAPQMLMKHHAAETVALAVLPTIQFGTQNQAPLRVPAGRGARASTGNQAAAPRQ